MGVMLRQSIEQYADECYDGQVRVALAAALERRDSEVEKKLAERHRLDAAFAELDNSLDLADGNRADKVLSDVARILTAARSGESRINDLLCVLARIFGGGLRTSW